MSWFSRRKSAELLVSDGGGEWGIYLACFAPWIENGRLVGRKAFPYKAKISAGQAEELLAQDPNLQFGMLFGRFIGDEFERGEQCFVPGSSDVVFQSLDGLHCVRLKCGPLSPGSSSHLKLDGA